MTAPKYKAKVVYWDSKRQITISHENALKWKMENKGKLPKFIYRFESTHEFLVYLELVRMFGAERIVRQHKLHIFPPSACYPHGKVWRVDFAILTLSYGEDFDFYVEAKGLFLPDNRVTLACLEQYNFAAFNRLRIVFTNNIPIEHRLVASINRSDYSRMLLTLPQLKALETL